MYVLVLCVRVSRMSGMRCMAVDDPLGNPLSD